jgi:hypothetical protein
MSLGARVLLDRGQVVEVALDGLGELVTLARHDAEARLLARPGALAPRVASDPGVEARPLGAHEHGDRKGEKDERDERHRPDSTAVSRDSYSAPRVVSRPQAPPGPGSSDVAAADGLAHRLPLERMAAAPAERSGKAAVHGEAAHEGGAEEDEGDGDER